MWWILFVRESPCCGAHRRSVAGSLDDLVIGEVRLMSNSPIEWMGEEPGHHVPDSEYGGASGLMQPEKTDVLSGDVAASGGHRVHDGIERETVSERSAVGRRAAINPLGVAEGKSGIPNEDGVLRDTASDTVLDASWSVAVGPNGEGGSISDQKDALGGTEVG